MAHVDAADLLLELDVQLAQLQAAPAPVASLSHDIDFEIVEDGLSYTHMQSTSIEIVSKTQGAYQRGTKSMRRSPLTAANVATSALHQRRSK